MKRKETRRLLRKWARADSEIVTLYDVIKTIVDEIDAVGDLHAQNLDGMPHAPTVGRPAEQAAVKRITLADRYRGRLAEANRHLMEDEKELNKARKLYGIFVRSCCLVGFHLNDFEIEIHGKKYRMEELKRT